MRQAWILVIIAAAVLSSAALADDSNQPYIDSIRKTLKPSDSEGYTEKIQKQLAPDNSEGYTEQLKNSPALRLEGTPGSYTEEERKKLEPKTEGGAIEAVREGHSELHYRKSTEVHNVFGFRVGIGETHNFVANNGIGTGRAFNDVYGQSYSPDLSIFAEHELIHSDYAGSVGVFAMANVAFYTGQGRFLVSLQNGYNGQTIDQNSTDVRFRFFEVPGTVGGSYRFNLMRYIKPYVMAGPTIIGAAEDRSDGNPTNKALSHGFWGSAGVSFLMDWMSRSSDWDRYQDYGIKHTYLTLEYSRMTTFSSPIDFTSSGVYAGFTFEY